MRVIISGEPCHYCELFSDFVELGMIRDGQYVLERIPRGPAVEIAHDERGCLPVCAGHALWRKTGCSRIGGHGRECAATDEHVHIRPLAEGPCDVHDWPIVGMARRLIDAMRERHGKGGVTACRECLERALLDAKGTGGT